jgi:hypothetical protein
MLLLLPLAPSAASTGSAQRDSVAADCQSLIKQLLSLMKLLTTELRQQQQALQQTVPGILLHLLQFGKHPVLAVPQQRLL